MEPDNTPKQTKKITRGPAWLSLPCDYYVPDEWDESPYVEEATCIYYLSEIKYNNSTSKI